MKHKRRYIERIAMDGRLGCSDLGVMKFRYGRGDGLLQGRLSRNLWEQVGIAWLMAGGSRRKGSI